MLKNELLSSRMKSFFTDGACLNNPGKGAYAWISESCSSWGVSPVYEFTTNNRMEMLGVLSVLRICVAKKIRRVRIYTDSRYLTEGLHTWSKKWGPRKQVKNIDLWNGIFILKKLLDLQLIWVKGHGISKQNHLVHNLCHNKVRGVA